MDNRNFLLLNSVVLGENRVLLQSLILMAVV
jgi:hypothetical protein